MWMTTLIVLVTIFFCRFLILYRKATSKNRLKRRKVDGEQTSLAVFLGSGGHTTEALSLLSALDFTRYAPRLYIIGEGDSLSERQANELENTKTRDTTSNYQIIVVPRARYVHQSLVSTPLSASWSLLHSLCLFLRPTLISRKPLSDVLLLNGPGTCFVLCIATYFTRFLGLPSPRLIYVESFARVNKLSLSGKLLRPFVDRFIVQWPNVLVDRGRGECHGWLV